MYAAKVLEDAVAGMDTKDHLRCRIPLNTIGTADLWKTLRKSSMWQVAISPYLSIHAFLSLLLYSVTNSFQGADEAPDQPVPLAAAQ